MNEKQVAFLKAIKQAINEASESKMRIVNALEIGSPIDEAACLEYIDHLDAFVNAGVKMSWICFLAFGEGSRAIAESLNKKISEC